MAIMSRLSQTRLTDSRRKLEWISRFVQPTVCELAAVYPLTTLLEVLGLDQLISTHFHSTLVQLDQKERVN